MKLSTLHLETLSNSERMALLPSTISSIERCRDVLNPKVKNLVISLNKVEIETALSGDMYTNLLVYVDLDNKYENKLRKIKLPQGWELTDTRSVSAIALAIGLDKAIEKHIEGSGMSSNEYTNIYNRSRAPFTRLVRLGDDPISKQEAELVTQSVLQALR